MIYNGMKEGNICPSINTVTYTLYYPLCEMPSKKDLSDENGIHLIYVQRIKLKISCYDQCRVK